MIVLSKVGLYRDGGSVQYQNIEDKGALYWRDYGLSSDTRGVLYEGHPNVEGRSKKAYGDFLIEEEDGRFSRLSIGKAPESDLSTKVGRELYVATLDEASINRMQFWLEPMGMITIEPNEALTFTDKQKVIRDLLEKLID